MSRLVRKANNRNLFNRDELPRVQIDTKIHTPKTSKPQDLAFLPVRRSHHLRRLGFILKQFVVELLLLFGKVVIPSLWVRYNIISWPTRLLGRYGGTFLTVFLLFHLTHLENAKLLSHRLN
jgi:hypothetical protein